MDPGAIWGEDVWGDLLSQLYSFGEPLSFFSVHFSMPSPIIRDSGEALGG